MDIFTELITEISAEEGIACTPLSHGWILRLTRNGQSRHIVGRHFDINGAAADLIACDKYACCMILQECGVPVVEHRLLFNPLVRTNWISEEGEWARALQYFNANNQRVVVKPNNGSQGHDVYLCETPKALERAVATIFLQEPNACICPFYDITHEYRVFYVNGASRYLYGKECAQVTGDGERDLRALADASGIPQENQIFSRDASYVPSPGERVRISWKHNLSNGASAFEVEDADLASRLRVLSERAAKGININFATVDIAALPDGSLTVMEINSGVVVQKFLTQHPEKRDTAKAIYTEALRGMFNNTTQIR